MGRYFHMLQATSYTPRATHSGPTNPTPISQTFRNSPCIRVARIQFTSATVKGVRVLKNTSQGVRKTRVFLGRWLNWSITYSISASPTAVRSRPLAKLWQIQVARPNHMLKRDPLECSRLYLMRSRPNAKTPRLSSACCWQMMSWLLPYRGSPIRSTSYQGE